MAQILIVDDEQSMRDFLSVMLKKSNYDVSTAADGTEAKKLIDSEEFDLVITDVMMPDISGIDILEYVKSRHPETAVLIITAYASHDTAVEAMKLGAEDYITKPFNIDEFSLIVNRSLQRKQLAEENIALRKELQREHAYESIVGKSRPMIELFNLIERIAATPTTVMITGESGTGKELVARAIHFNSRRSKHRFVSINCGALPESLLESELFGYEKGAFTGADKRKTGLFEAADGGTVFLDEIGETPHPMQVKLLRTMQERTIRRVGGHDEIPVDVRIIAATNVDLEELVNSGEFREDLYYRVNVIRVALPSLRERSEDIMLLSLHFLDKYATLAGRAMNGFAESARRCLENYHWPGNVRELENAIERAVALEPNQVITEASLPDTVRQASQNNAPKSVSIPNEGFELEPYLEDLRMTYVKKAMDITVGKQTEAAKLLGMSTRSLRYLLDKYDLK